MCGSSADLHDGVGKEFVLRDLEIKRRRAFANARRGIVVRTVTRTEVAAELALDLTLARAERDAPQVGADAHRDQPVLLARLGPVGERFRIAERAGVDFLG